MYAFLDKLILHSCLIFSNKILEYDSHDEQHFRERSRNGQLYLSITIDISTTNSHLTVDSGYVDGNTQIKLAIS